jgi:hypothetical protein
MKTPSNIPSKQVLRTFPSGWCYYAESDSFPAQSIEDLGEQLGFNIDPDAERDDLEGALQFMNVVVALANQHGFTHIQDSEIDFDSPVPIREAFAKTLRKDRGYQDEEAQSQFAAILNQLK